MYSVSTGIDQEGVFTSLPQRLQLVFVRNGIALRIMQ